MLPLCLTWLMLSAPDELDERLIASTAWLQAGGRGSGTAWVIDRQRRWLLTARHVVGDEKRVKLFFPVREGKSWRQERDFYEQQITPKQGRVVHLDEERDLALIECADLPETAQQLPLLAEAAPVATVGYLIGQRQDTATLWTLSTGYLRQRARLKEGYFWAGKRLVADKQVAIFDLPVASGDSGGAVCDRQGKVIGILSAIANASTALVVEASEINTFLSQVKAEPVPKVASPQQSSLEPLLMATAWISPRSTQGRNAGVVFDGGQRLLLSSAQAVGDSQTVEILFPFKKEGQVVGEREHYRDLLEQALQGHLIRGLVLARDESRDLALIEAFELPPAMTEISLAKEDAKVGDRVASVSHPSGLEVLWMVGQGNIRATARLPLSSRSTKGKPQVHLFQLPSSGDSSGGPIVNAQGSLIGILSAKEGSRQSVVYAATREELVTFIKESRSKWEPATPEEFGQRALKLERIGQVATAEGVWEIARKQHPKSALIQAHLCRQLLRQGHHQDALALLERVDLQEVPARDLTLLAQELVRSKQLEKAKALAERVLRQESQNGLAMMVLAECTTGEQSQKLLKEAQFYAPDEPSVYLARARRHPAGSEEQVLDDLSRAYELNPSDLSTLRQRASLYTSLKKYPQAVRDWQRLTELAPKDTSPWLELSQVHALMGNSQASQEAAKAANRIKQFVPRK